MKRVLIIEDNDDNMYMLKFILEQHNICVLMAITGLDGFDLALKELPDLILMDIQLPDVNGLEVTKMIRNSDIMDKIPIMAISSYAMTGDKQKALNAGCNAYLEKPIEPETIMNEILKFL
ncbi:MAG: two-component system, cell cycle response regulator DivK [Bacteroidota bacterium]|nr:two-component system, cell cycle response regulator DivK [Bacteroidota bacterium]